MPIGHAVPTEGAARMAALRHAGADRDARLGQDAWYTALALEDQDRQRPWNAIQAYKDRRAEKKAAEAAEGDTPWGALGGTAAGIVAGILALPTGGLSLATLPAVAAVGSVGGTIGGAFDRSPSAQASGAQLNRGLSEYGNRRPDASNQYPDEPANTPAATGTPATPASAPATPGGAFDLRQSGTVNKAASTGSKSSTASKGSNLLAPERLKIELEKRGVVPNPYFSGKFETEATA